VPKKRRRSPTGQSAAVQGGRRSVSAERANAVTSRAAPGEVPGSARREQAKAERQRIRRRQARGLFLRKYSTWAVAVVVVAALVVLVVREQVSAREHSREERALLAQTAQAAQAAGCSGVQTTAEYPGGRDRDHVSTIPPLSSYPTQPPASGPHDQTPLGSGVYPKSPPIDRAIHSLEHGAAEIWYAPSATGSDLTRLQQFFRGQDHVIVAPYGYPGPGGQLPAGREMVLVAWHRIQFCNQISLPVATAFEKLYHYDSSDTGAYRGVAPEPGFPI
jgi:hypothetical protein